MRKMLCRLALATLALACSLEGALAQGLTINQLGSGSALSGSELIPMFQGSNPAVTTTPSAIKSYVLGGFGTGVATALGNALNTSGGLVGYSGALGTPTQGVLTNATGLPIWTGLTGAGTGVLAAMANAVNGSEGLLTYGIIGTSGASVPLLNAANTYSAVQTFNAGDLAISGGSATAGLATVTSGGVVSSEANATVAQGGTGQTSLTANAFLTGNGTNGINQVAITGLVLGNGSSAPTAYGGCSAVSNEWITALSASGSCTQAQPAIGNISGWGTGVATALGNALNASGGPVGYSGALGTPTQGVLTNATGLPISTGVSGLGTGVATALGDATNASGGVVTATTGCTSWTPTDQSGAGLTFTNVSAEYCQYGNMVFVYGTLIYPSTSNTSQMTISTPVAVPNQSYAKVPAPFVGSAANDFLMTVPNTSTMVGQTATGSAIENGSLSGKTINFLLIYPAS